MRSRIFFLTSVLLGAGGLAVLFGLAGVWSVAGFALAVGLAWALPDVLPGQRKVAWLRQGWLSNSCFVSLSLVAVGLLWLGRPWWLAMAFLSFILAAWDLQAFRLRVYPAEKVGGLTVLRAYHSGIPVAPGQVQGEFPSASPAQAENAAFERAHLRALGLVTLASAGGALLLYLIAGLIRFQVGLGLAFGLTLALVLGLIFLARLVLRQ